jgi:hypothetical protein
LSILKQNPLSTPRQRLHFPLPATARLSTQLSSNSVCAGPHVNISFPPLRVVRVPQAPLSTANKSDSKIPEPNVFCIPSPAPLPPVPCASACISAPGARSRVEKTGPARVVKGRYGKYGHAALAFTRLRAPVPASGANIANLCSIMFNFFHFARSSWISHPVVLSFAGQLPARG